MKKKVVIVGGGFAGVAAAKRFLRSRYAHKNFEITLIDKNDYQLFQPSLFRVITSGAGLAELFSVATIKFSEIFKGQEKDIEVLKREVDGVDFDKKQISLKVGGVQSKKMDYDYLVVASGSKREHDYLTLTSFEDAVKIKHELEKVFKTKSRGEEINICVVGGGPTGTELVVALFEYGQKLAKKYSHFSVNINFKLIEAGDSILSKHSPWVCKNVERTLKGIGIEVLTNTNAKKYENEADLIAWAIGAKPILLSEELNDLNNKLQPKDRNNIFSVKASTAQAAAAQGKYIAEAIVKKDQKKEVEDFKPKKDFYIIELGYIDAFLDLGFIKLKDLPAFWAHKLAFLRYYASVLGRKRAINWLKKFEDL